MSESAKDVYDPSRFFGSFGPFINVLDPDFLAQYRDVLERARKLLDENEDILKRLLEDDQFVHVFDSDPPMKIFRSGNITAEDTATSFRAVLCGTEECMDPPAPLSLFCRGCYGRIQSANQQAGASEIESFESNRSEMETRKRHRMAAKDLYVVDVSGDAQGVTVEQHQKGQKRAQLLFETSMDSADEEQVLVATPSSLPLEVIVGSTESTVDRSKRVCSGNGNAHVHGNAEPIGKLPSNHGMFSSPGLVVSPRSTGSPTSSWVAPPPTPYPHLLLKSSDSDETFSMPRFIALNEDNKNTNSSIKESESGGRGRSSDFRIHEEWDDDDWMPSGGNLAPYVFPSAQSPVFQTPDVPQQDGRRGAPRKRKAQPLIIEDEDSDMRVENEQEKAAGPHTSGEEIETMEAESSQPAAITVPESQMSNSSDLNETLMELQAIGSDGY